MELNNLNDLIRMFNFKLEVILNRCGGQTSDLFVATKAASDRPRKIFQTLMAAEFFIPSLFLRFFSQKC